MYPITQIHAHFHVQLYTQSYTDHIAAHTSTIEYVHTAGGRVALCLVRRTLNPRVVGSTPSQATL